MPDVIVHIRIAAKEISQSKLPNKLSGWISTMPLVPQEWNVVVVGHWNRAILSPAGIAKRLFRLPEGTPVQVLVPLDVVGPYHIRHENVTVVPSNDRLLVAPVQDTILNLVEAIGIARRALEDLPRTPVFAAGMNLVYKSDSGVDVLERAVTSTWDERLSDRGYTISSRAIVRSADWRGGTINVTIKHESKGAASVKINFDFKSQDSSELGKWLNLSEEQIREQVDRIMLETIELSREDICDV